MYSIYSSETNKYIICMKLYIFLAQTNKNVKIRFFDSVPFVFMNN